MANQMNSLSHTKWMCVSTISSLHLSMFMYLVYILLESATRNKDVAEYAISKYIAQNA